MPLGAPLPLGCVPCVRSTLEFSPGHRSTAGDSWVWMVKYPCRATKWPLLSCDFAVQALYIKMSSSTGNSSSQHLLPKSASVHPKPLPDGLHICFLSFLFLRLRVGFCPSLQPLVSSAGIWQGELGPSCMSMAKQTLKPRSEASHREASPPRGIIEVIPR